MNMNYCNEAKFLRRHRLKLKLTQKQLAQRLGLKHDQFICNIERGNAGIPVERIKTFASVLNVEVKKLVKLKAKTYENWLNTL